MIMVMMMKRYALLQQRLKTNYTLEPEKCETRGKRKQMGISKRTTNIGDK